MFGLIVALLGLGGVYLVTKKSTGKGSSGKLVTVNPGEVWTIGIDTNREMSEIEWGTYMAYMKQVGDVMGVTRSGNTYVITIRYTVESKLPAVGSKFTLGGDTITVRFAQRAPIG
jgi:hypothetical protein